MCTSYSSSWMPGIPPFIFFGIRERWSVASADIAISSFCNFGLEFGSGVFAGLSQSGARCFSKGEEAEEPSPLPLLLSSFFSSFQLSPRGCRIVSISQHIISHNKFLVHEVQISYKTCCEISWGMDMESCWLLNPGKMRVPTNFVPRTLWKIFIFAFLRNWLCNRGPCN